jgi:hypothetical protein
MHVDPVKIPVDEIKPHPWEVETQQKAKPTYKSTLTAALCMVFAPLRQQRKPTSASQGETLSVAPGWQSCNLCWHQRKVLAVSHPRHPARSGRYRGWLTTPQPPAMARHPPPTHPRHPSEEVEEDVTLSDVIIPQGTTSGAGLAAIIHLT